MQGLTVGRWSPTLAGGEVRAVHVEDFLSWVYGAQRAHVVYDQGLYGNEARTAWHRGASPDGCVGVERLAVLGRRVDGGGRVGLGQLHPDAEAAHEWVLGAGRAGHLLVLYGKRGEVPDWLPDHAPRLVPVWRGAPRYGADGMPAAGSFRLVHVRGNAVACMVAEAEGDVHPAVVEAMRGEWSAWWAAAAALAEALGGRLLSVRLRPPRLGPTPWLP